MVRPIIKNKNFLARKSAPASQADARIAQDLLDTFLAHKDECVGMAANMIGSLKRIIVVDLGFAPVIMYNPMIMKKDGKFDTEEECLCLEGEQKVTRYAVIEVAYIDHAFKLQRKVFTGFNAQIIQHEIDHCNGIVI